MFSQFRHVVEGLAQPRPSQPSPPRSTSSQLPSPAKPFAERPLKAKLEDRLRATFTIGEESNPNTPTPSTRASPAPQFVAEHPLSINHPLSPAAIPLPSSPPHDGHDFLPIDASLTLPDSLSSLSPDVSDELTLADTGSNIVIEPEPVNQDSPQTSPLADSPIASQVPEEKLVASGEGTGMCEASKSVITSCISCDQDIMPDASVVEITQADRRRSTEVPIPTEKPQSEPSFSDGTEALQERLKLMEQQFEGQR